MVVRRRADRADGVWPARRSRGGINGLLLATVLLVGGLGLLFWGVRQSTDGLALLAALLAALAVGAAAAVSLAVIGYYRLRYDFGPGMLVIRSSGPSESVPLADIEAVYTGQRLGPLRSPRGWSWPGYYVGVARHRSMGTLRVFCTDRDTDALVIIVTPANTLVISPDDAPAFRRELIRRIELEEPRAPATDTGQARPPEPLLVGLLGASVVALLASLATILVNFQALPELTPLQLDPLGRPAMLGPRGELFYFPLIGGVVLGLNFVILLLLRGREPAAAVLLAGTAGLAQVVILLATLRVLP